MVALADLLLEYDCNDAEIPLLYMRDAPTFKPLIGFFTCMAKNLQSKFAGACL